MKNNIKLYLNTIKYLKPLQIYYRLSNRLKRELYKRKILTSKIPNSLNINENFTYLIRVLDFDKEYIGRFDIEDILKDKFKFINITNQVELSNSWNNKELQQLWRYNLHYFEYLFRVAYEYSLGNNKSQYYKKYKSLIKNWIDNNPFAHGDGWHPYTISLRVTNWISTYEIFRDKIVQDDDFYKIFKESLYLQYKYLQDNLEKDVLGNHYFENIKAIVVCSTFFDETKIKDKFKKELLIQLKEQISEDGMHFELSPMYHKIILEDLIKITYWMKDDEIYNDLIPYLQKMLDVTYSLEENFGKTPAFNDSADGVSKDYKCLLEACNMYFMLSPHSITNLDKSGFYIFEDRNRKLIFDTGEICPSYLPAHGHCDALSFELSTNGVPYIVNSGTYKYEGGEWRNYFRSTKAHNTVSILSQEQSQFWGSFRVAKRISKVRRRQFFYKGIKFFAGAYVSYSGVEHKRFIGILDEYTILILDYVNVKPNNSTQSYLHFMPETHIEINNNLVRAVKHGETIMLSTIGIRKINIEQGWYSEQFNKKKENKLLVFEKDESKNYFGYLLQNGVSKYNIIETVNEIILINEKKIIINYKELGVML